LIEYRTLVIEYSMFVIENMSLSIKYGAVFHENWGFFVQSTLSCVFGSEALVIEYRALMVKNRSLFIENRAVLNENTSLLTEHGFVEKCE